MTTIRFASTDPPPALKHAARRLQDGFRRARLNVSDLLVTLVDIAASPLPAESPSRTGLDGDQAHRVLVRRGKVWLLGHGPLGVAYAVERFRDQVLGLDPLASWTGLADRPAAALPATFDLTVGAPRFAHRIYFENDADELLWHHGRRLQLERKGWRELIDTLIALGYSGLQPFDSLGRSEFWSWEHYTTHCAWKFDYALAAWAIRYARTRGLTIAVQPSLSLGWRRLDPRKGCYARHQKRWQALWTHYLTRTPLRDAGIFIGGVGDPLWDGDYRCRCRHCRGDWRAVRDQAGRDQHLILRTLRPEAAIARCLYGHPAGEPLRLDGLDGAVIEHSDHGYAEIPSRQPVPPGIPQAGLVHAGYWLDHTVLNPCTERLAATVRDLAAAGATRWLRVNGQSFRPCLPLVEAAAACAWDPDRFDAAAFQRAWIQRRLRHPEAPDRWTAFLAALLDLNESVRTTSKERGYAALLLLHVIPLLRDLAGAPAAPAGTDLTQVSDTETIFACFTDEASTPEHAHAVAEAAARTVAAAEVLHALAGNRREKAFLDDLALFPARLFAALAGLYQRLADLRAARDASALIRDADLDGLEAAHDAFWRLHLTGPKHPRWREWYLPQRQRIFGAPPPPAWSRAVRRRLHPDDDG